MVLVVVALVRVMHVCVVLVGVALMRVVLVPRRTVVLVGIALVHVVLVSVVLMPIALVIVVPLPVTFMVMSMTVVLMVIALMRIVLMGVVLMLVALMHIVLVPGLAVVLVLVTLMHVVLVSVMLVGITFVHIVSQYLILHVTLKRLPCGRIQGVSYGRLSHGKECLTRGRVLAKGQNRSTKGVFSDTDSHKNYCRKRFINYCATYTDTHSHYWVFLSYFTLIRRLRHSVSGPDTALRRSPGGRTPPEHRSLPRTRVRAIATPRELSNHPRRRRLARLIFQVMSSLDRTLRAGQVDISSNGRRPFHSWECSSRPAETNSMGSLRRIDRSSENSLLLHMIE